MELSAALAGTLLMIGKIWDAITDPITGYISDRTISRWGRRRPYMFVGAVISFFSMGLMFTKVSFSSELFLFLYLTFLYCLLNTAYTLVNIPYAALLPELSSDYNERTILTGYRMSFAVVGTFVGAAAVLPIIGFFSTKEAGWTFVGYFMGAIMLITALITIWAVREPKRVVVIEQKGFFVTYKEVLFNKVFLSALIPWSLFIMGTSMVQGALIYFFKDIFGNEGLFQIALVLLLTFSLAFIPVWVKISKKIGKKNSYMIGMGIMSVGVLSFSLLGEVLGPIFAIIVMAVSGIGLSTHYVMPHAILPDVVEYDAHHHKGIRREGVYSSLWTFMSKIGQALALAISGWVLAIFAYNPNSVSSLANIGIKLMCGPLPIIFYIIGIIILHYFPIDEKYYHKMMKGEI